MRYQPDDLSDSPPPAEPINGARDKIAGTLEASFPGWTITHDLFGWRATRRRDSETFRAQSSTGLAALLPFYGD